MFFNHMRRMVHEWDRIEQSLCPDCFGELIAKRCEIVRSHWAHKPDKLNKTICKCVESEWHLAMKSAYLFPGWEVESPIEINGKKYRIDAMNKQTGRAREFIHSLSDYYVQKHRDMKSYGLDVLWIFDGEEFGSRRAEYVRKGGIRNLLKPKASSLHDEIGGIVHCYDRFYRHWKYDIWFPVQSEILDKIHKRIEEYIHPGEDDE